MNRYQVGGTIAVSLICALSVVLGVREIQPAGSEASTYFGLATAVFVTYILTVLHTIKNAVDK